MSEVPDPLEAELSALRPIEISFDRRRRIAESLVAPAPTVRRRLWRLSIAASLAATCLSMVFFRWGPSRDIGQETIDVRVVSAPSIEAAGSGPTLLTYERALSRSPEEMDVLLDSDAVVARRFDSEPTRIYEMTRSDAALHALLGGY